MQGRRRHAAQPDGDVRAQCEERQLSSSSPSVSPALLRGGTGGSRSLRCCVISSRVRLVVALFALPAAVLLVLSFILIGSSTAIGGSTHIIASAQPPVPAAHSSPPRRVHAGSVGASLFANPGQADPPLDRSKQLKGSGKGGDSDGRGRGRGRGRGKGRGAADSEFVAYNHRPKGADRKAAPQKEEKKEKKEDAGGKLEKRRPRGAKEAKGEEKGAKEAKGEEKGAPSGLAGMLSSAPRATLHDVPQGGNGPVLTRLHAASAAILSTARSGGGLAHFGTSHLGNGTRGDLSDERLHQLRRRYRQRKFIFPLLSQGPNNQFLQFRVALARAHSLNRTLVLPVWLPHNPKFLHLHPGAPPTPSRDKWLSQVWYPFGAVFDVEPITRYVRTISLAHFRAISDGKLERCATPHSARDDDEAGFDAYLHLSGLSCASRASIEDRSFSSVRFLGYHEYDYEVGTRDRYFEYLRWSSIVRRQADAISTTLGLRPAKYIAAHIRVADARWERNDCSHTMHGVPVPSVSCGDAQRSINYTTLAQAIWFTMRSAAAPDPEPPHPRLVYIASNMNCTDERIQRISAMLTQRSVRTVCAQDALGALVRSDNFVASLIEQELCARAAAFVGSKYSTWTDTVRGARSYDDRAEMDRTFEDLWALGIR